MVTAKTTILSAATIALTKARIDVPSPNRFIEHLPRPSTTKQQKETHALRKSCGKGQSGGVENVLVAARAGISGEQNCVWFG